MPLLNVPHGQHEVRPIGIVVALAYDAGNVLLVQALHHNDNGGLLGIIETG